MRAYSSSMPTKWPAGAVIQRLQALPGITGRKGCLGGHISLSLNVRAQLGHCEGNGMARGGERGMELMGEGGNPLISWGTPKAKGMHWHVPDAQTRKPG